MGNSCLAPVKIGLLFSLLTIAFGISLGIGFGLFGPMLQEWFKGVASSHQDIHDEQSIKEIWRYIQGAHFHSTGIGSFTLGLVIVTALLDMSDRLKKVTAALISLGGLYPFAWLSAFFFSSFHGAPSRTSFSSRLVFCNFWDWLPFAGLGLFVCKRNLWFCSKILACRQLGYGISGCQCKRLMDNTLLSFPKTMQIWKRRKK